MRTEYECKVDYDIKKSAVRLRIHEVKSMNYEVMRNDHEVARLNMRNVF